MNENAVNAAALQDNLIRSLGLGLSSAAPRARRKRPAARPALSRYGTAALTAAAAAPPRDLLPPPPSTLAQVRGLVPAPPARLTDSEWAGVEASAAARACADCPICREPFHPGAQQVILDCSHVFHRQCIAAFMRHQRLQRGTAHAPHTCPVCRKAQYQMRVSEQGVDANRAACVVRLQAWLRGLAARRAFREALRALHAPGGGDPARRRAFAAAELARHAARVALAADRAAATEDALEALFAECDKNLAFSHTVFGQGPTTAAAVKGDREAACRALGGGGGLDAAAWDGVLAKAQVRADVECCICMGNLFEEGGGAAREVVLLTCTHWFHLACVKSFEEYAIGDKKRCAVCRAGPYESIAVGADGVCRMPAAAGKPRVAAKKKAAKKSPRVPKFEPIDTSREALRALWGPRLGLPEAGGGGPTAGAWDVVDGGSAGTAGAAGVAAVVGDSRVAAARARVARAGRGRSRGLRARAERGAPVSAMIVGSSRKRR